MPEQIEAKSQNVNTNNFIRKNTCDKWNGVRDKITALLKSTSQAIAISCVIP